MLIKQFVKRIPIVLAVFLIVSLVVSFAPTYAVRDLPQQPFSYGKFLSTYTGYSTTADGHINAVSFVYNTVWTAAAGDGVQAATATATLGQSIPATYQIWRDYFYFDTSSIPASATITLATLSLYGQTDDSVTDFLITIQNGQVAGQDHYPHSPLVVADYDKTFYAGDGGSLTTLGFLLNNYNVITLNATGRSWINIGAGATTKLCLRSSLDIAGTAPTGDEYVNIWATEKGTIYRPKLYVEYTTPAPTCALTGTVTAAITEAAIIAGGKTIILTLTDDTWVAAGAVFNAQRQNIINGIDSAQSEATGWDAEVKAKIPVTDVVRTSDNTTTITLTAEAGYNITAQETITATIPATAVTSAGIIVATPTFTIDTATPTVTTTNPPSVIGSTTATLDGAIANLNGGGNATRHGFGWDVHTHVNYNDYLNDVGTNGNFGVAAFTDAAAGLPTGTTIYIRAYATSPMGTGQGAEVTFLTKPAAPTNVAATDGTWTTKVVVTWTKSTGATDYHVWRDAFDCGAAGDVATYDDTGAGAPVITSNAATASDATSAVNVVLSANETVADGTHHVYKVVASNATGNSVDSATDIGWRGTTTLTYQWYRSAADSNAAYSTIAGGTTDPYADTGGVVAPDGRYYLATISMTGATSENTTADRGNMAAPPTVTTAAVSGFDKVSATANGAVTSIGAGATTITERGFKYSETGSFLPGDFLTEPEIGSFGISPFSLLLSGLEEATVYSYKAYAINNTGGLGEGGVLTFSTKGALTLYEEHSVSCNTTATAPGLYGNNVIFQTFTTDNVSIAHTVSRVKIFARRVNVPPADPGIVTISIRNATAGTPSGEDITSATVDSLTFSTTFAWFSTDLDSEIGLEADKMYAIVVEAPSGDAANYLQWSMSNTDTFADGTGGYSADGGATWTKDTNRDYCFQVWGNPTAEMLDAKVFSDYLETGDWLITCLYYNIYPPYYDDGDDVSLYFYLQLVDGNIVKAQTKVSAWGFKPGSIYLSHKMTEPLEWGKAYKVRMYGNFGTHPYIDYTLRPVDWLGKDMNKLAMWCRVTSGKIESFYGDTLTTFVTGKGEVLNAQGGSIFVEGIPELDKVLPNLFETATGALSGSVKESTGALQRELQWEEMWGPTVTRAFTNWGNVLSVSGSTIGAMFFFLAYILTGALTFPTGHTMVGIGISFPLILVAFFTGLIPLVLAGVLLGVSTILLVREGIWKGG